MANGILVNYMAWNLPLKPIRGSLTLPHGSKPSSEPHAMLSFQDINSPNTFLTGKVLLSVTLELPIWELEEGVVTLIFSVYHSGNKKKSGNQSVMLERRLQGLTVIG